MILTLCVGEIFEAMPVFLSHTLFPFDQYSIQEWEGLKTELKRVQLRVKNS